MAPSYDSADKFKADWSKMSPEARAEFMVAVKKLVTDLNGDGQLRPGLRVKGVKGIDGVYEMTWAPDGRATFQYGTEIIKGKHHVIWRRIGTHDIFGNP